jgi:putative hydrolase of the HAD superfamily
MLNYSAVIFDLFGTLVTGWAETLFRESLYGMADAVGVDRDRFRDAWINETTYDRNVGVHATIAANVLHICKGEGVAPSDEAVARAVAIRNEFTRVLLKPRPDAVATMRALRDAGLRLALVSDCSADVPELWDTTPFASLIDLPIFSCSVGMKKPDPRIFLMASDGLGVPPERCIYVGDGGSRELTGASEVGMYAVLIAGFDEELPDYAKDKREKWEGRRIENLSELLEIAGIAR